MPMSKRKMSDAEKMWRAIGGTIERSLLSYYHYVAVRDGKHVNHGMCPESAAAGAVSAIGRRPCACRPGSDCYGNGGSHGPRSSKGGW
jgi:hypothetical protein